jgi:hypothetical protein
MNTSPKEYLPSPDIMNTEYIMADEVILEYLHIEIVNYIYRSSENPDQVWKRNNIEIVNCIYSTFQAQTEHRHLFLVKKKYT